MTSIKVTEIERTYKNFGMHAEQCLAYTLTGEVRRGGIERYNTGSDIPEYNMSVKSSGFSLMSGNLCKSQNFNEIVEQFFNETVSEQFAYVTQDMVAYIMNRELFKLFVENFCSLTRESSSNGGRYKVRMRKENKKVLAFLTEMS